MKRALQLARNGEGRVAPNPMVGAVIVHDDKIIGEGFHAFFGGPHAEVNAINSVDIKNRVLLKESTIYVTLEPCAHFGKTPPCANLIVATGIPNVVIGSLDPNPLVAGKGVDILKKAGINVSTGILAPKCMELNRHFYKAHTTGLPWIILKWAQSSDGFMAGLDDNDSPYPVTFSNSLSRIHMHRLRASCETIMVGSNTEKIDKPELTTRYWGGNSPLKYVARNNMDCLEFVENLKKEGATCLMVEGGAKLLNSFISLGLYDELRVETSPLVLHKGLPAPSIPSNVRLVKTEVCRDNIIQYFRR